MAVFACDLCGCAWSGFDTAPPHNCVGGRPPRIEAPKIAWIPTPLGDPANGRWPEPSEIANGTLWHDREGGMFLTQEWIGDIALYMPVAWQPLPARWEPPKKPTVETLSDEFIDNIRAGDSLNDIAKQLPDFIIAVTRAILAEHKQ